MFTRTPAPASRSVNRRIEVVPSAILFLLASCLAVPARADLGRWTPPDSVYEMGGEAIHMALLPGDGAPYHSRILWWQSSSIGGEWGWVPGDAECARNPRNSVLTPLGGPWNTVPDLFCSGHIQVGRNLLAVGGNGGGEDYGLRDARIFTPGTGYNPGAWSPTDSMAEHRW